MKTRTAGLIYGPMEHYLDHLAPLCSLLEIPLILSDENLFALSQKYYPDLNAKLLHPALLPEAVITDFDILLVCTPRDLFDETFFLAQQLHQKRLMTIWCPHGNSDKGTTATTYMEHLNKEEAALVYGEQMLDVLKEKGVFSQLKTHLKIGNLRFEYFNKYRKFYTSLARSLKLPPNKKTLLYAPTWHDHANNSSFFDATPSLIEELPEDCNLIIKLHPNIRKSREIDLEVLLGKYQASPRVLFLEEYPPIYSLCDLCDLYIGDMSSIGYDYLTFDKPLFFLGEGSAYLFQAGTLIGKKDYASIYEKIDQFFEFETRDFSEIRRAVYNYTFAPIPQELHKEFHSLCDTLSKNNSPFI